MRKAAGVESFLLWSPSKVLGWESLLVLGLALVLCNMDEQMAEETGKRVRTVRRGAGEKRFSFSKQMC